MTDIQVFKLIQDSQQKKQPVFLLIVVKGQGGSPEKIGFKMAVSANAQTGTIDGRIMEHSLIHKDRRKLKEDTSRMPLNSYHFFANHGTRDILCQTGRNP